MKKHTVIGVDLSKESFQTVLVEGSKEVSNKSLSRIRFVRWLSKQKPSLVALEACGSAHFWARKARSFGHEVVILPAKAVAPYRQGHKTDKNDALAIAIACRQPKLKTVSEKSIEQQGLQSIQRIREHWSDHVVATSNMIRGLLFEFGIVIPKGFKALKREIPLILEDAENELPFALRDQIAAIFSALLSHQQSLEEVDKELKKLINQQVECRQLMALEGVAQVNALGLHLVLGSQGKSFKNGREAAACIGLTPKQYSTGGTVTLGGISKKIAHKRLRSSLIQGALAVAKVVSKREPRNSKESWLKRLIELKGMRRAAVALANKTVRTAWAMLHHNQTYRQPEPIVTEAVSLSVP